MGLNTFPKYSVGLAAFYPSGEREKGGKMSASKMCEALFEKYPSRHEIPIEQHITSFISNIGGMSSERLHAAIASEGGSSRIHRRGMAGEYHDALKTNGDRDATRKPRDGRDRLLQFLRLDSNQFPSTFPSDKFVRTKLSSLKLPIKSR